jgi:cytochrome b subunit of formate dehydrogenase
VTRKLRVFRCHDHPDVGRFDAAAGAQIVSVTLMAALLYVRLQISGTVLSRRALSSRYDGVLVEENVLCRRP